MGRVVYEYRYLNGWGVIDEFYFCGLLFFILKVM